MGDFQNVQLNQESTHISNVQPGMRKTCLIINICYPSSWLLIPGSSYSVNLKLTPKSLNDVLNVWEVYGLVIFPL